MKVKELEAIMLEKFPDAPLRRDETGLTGALMVHSRADLGHQGCGKGVRERWFFP